MEIFIWQAWASNNSGSYTMVGSFDSEEKARLAASTLQKIAVEHGAWSQAEHSDEVSPLIRFCREEGLRESPELGKWDDWPQYDDQSHPDIFAVGKQIFVHSGYTVDLVPTFGEYIYRQGGRVSHELNHSHHPIVCEISLWWDWQDKQRQEKEARLLTMIQDKETLLSQLPGLQHTPLVRKGDHGGLVLFIVFENLVEGLQALPALCAPCEARHVVNISEGLDNERPLIAFEKMARSLW